MYIPQEIMTLADALEKVKLMPFPHAVNGESVLQFGYWFDRTSDTWVPRPDQPCILTAYIAEQERIAAEIAAVEAQQ